MKNKLILMLAISTAILSACSDDNDAGANVTPATSFLIASDSTSDSSGSVKVRKFFYNSSKKLVKVASKNYASTTFDNYDTVIYNAAGQVSSVEERNVGNATATTTSVYNYTGNVLTSVTESGTNTAAYVLTRTFTYAAGKLSAVAEVYSAGSGDSQNFTDITFNGNNISGLTFVGIGAITATAETTAPNPYYGLNFDSRDFLNIFNQNNILKAYLTAAPTQVLVDNSYTYASGRVATIVDASNGYTTNITYIEL